MHAPDTGGTAAGSDDIGAARTAHPCEIGLSAIEQVSLLLAREVPEALDPPRNAAPLADVLHGDADRSQR